MKLLFKRAYFVFLHLFAVAGILFVGVFFAIRFKWTNVNGSVDSLSSGFQENIENANILGVMDVASTSVSTDAEIENLSKVRDQKIKVLCELNELSYIAPKNVKKIMEMRRIVPNSDFLTERMFYAIKTHLEDSRELEINIDKCKKDFDKKVISETELFSRVSTTNSVDIFKWVNTKEWNDVMASIKKDEKVIRKAALDADIDPRLIASDLMVEQLRMFFSVRELYKKYFEPLKILANSNKISLGVMAIKEDTAIQIENHLKDKNSPYYLGPKYENVLDYKTNDVAGERYRRLTENTHYYSYFYAGLYLKQMIKQWNDAGYGIDNRPEIICTLFNVGFPQSRPNPSPKVGGSNVNIDGKLYSFGRLGFEFFYSGEMTSLFPYLIK